MASSLSSDSNDEQQRPQHVVIAGAGIIGTCTAYYLAKNYQIRTTLVDPTGRIAPAASGKAGGFLALDWNDHSPTGPLTRRSFQLHQDLADTLGAESIQYRRLTCAAVSVSAADSMDATNRSRRKPKGKKLQGIEWAQPSDDEESSVLGGMRPLGNEDTIAQVHPQKLCQRLWQATQSIAEGCQLRQGTVVGSQHSDDDGLLEGVKLSNDEIIPADALLGFGDPEVYVRPDQTAYCTGFPDEPRIVIEKPGEEEVRKEKIESIVQSVRKASGGDTAEGTLGSDPILEQACYLPSTNDGVPVMGALPDSETGGKGCYIAAGHTCWGILMGPASGESMASLIATGRSEFVDLQPFMPSRYRSIGLVASSKV